MKIVFLDGYTVNPGDISWDELSELGDLTVYDRTEPENVLERAKDAEVLIVNKTGLQREHFEQLPSLKLVCVLQQVMTGLMFSLLPNMGYGCVMRPDMVRSRLRRCSFLFCWN